MSDSYNIQIVLILAVGFAAASLFGILSQRIKLSPILGYLLAGYLIGPYSPGFVADQVLAEQLAEIGVILMLFGVGLHLKWQELVNVKNVAIPGAIGQTIVAATCAALLVQFFGWPLETGIIIGLAIGVASTVVMVRVLSDYHLIKTFEGHVAIGWLIVEDILTVMVLILLPILAAVFQGRELSILGVLQDVGLAVGRFFLLTLIMFTAVKKLILFILTHVARLRSHELFTLTLLAITFVIASSSALIFGISIALGSFMAGMVIGQTHVRHQASANALPLQDAFVVIFFLSVGMIFNPMAIVHHFGLFMGLLAIILVIKPLSAFLIVWLMRYPLKVALTIALALAQIGEFSFILSEEAIRFKLLPDEGYDVIVACALVSISLNPILFKWIGALHESLKQTPSQPSNKALMPPSQHVLKAIIVGFGVVGKGLEEVLRQRHFEVTVIDQNVDTIAFLSDQTHQRAVFGDAAIPTILETAHVDQADLLLITVPDIQTTLGIIEAVRPLNPHLKILARTQYLTDHLKLKDLQIDSICGELVAKQAFVQKVSHLIDKQFSHKSHLRKEWIG